MKENEIQCDKKIKSDEMLNEEGINQIGKLKPIIIITTDSHKDKNDDEINRLTSLISGKN